MKSYKGIYKCRLCGECFCECATTKIETAWKAAAVFVGWPATEEDLSQRKHTLHLCEDGGIGVADFQGFKKEE